MVALVEESSVAGPAAIDAVPSCNVLPLLYVAPIRPFLDRLAPKLHDTAGYEPRFSVGALRWTWTEFPSTVDLEPLLKLNAGTACLSYAATGNVYFFVDSTETVVLHSGLGRIPKRGATLRVLTIHDVPGVSVTVRDTGEAPPAKQYVERIRKPNHVLHSGQTATQFMGKIVFTVDDTSLGWHAVEEVKFGEGAMAIVGGPDYQHYNDRRDDVVQELISAKSVYRAEPIVPAPGRPGHYHILAAGYNGCRRRFHTASAIPGVGIVLVGGLDASLSEPGDSPIAVLAARRRNGFVPEMLVRATRVFEYEFAWATVVPLDTSKSSASSSPASSVPAPVELMRMHHSAVVWRDFVIVYGGEISGGGVFNDVVGIACKPAADGSNCVNVQLKRFETRGDLPLPRSHHSCALVGDMMFVYGGVVRGVELTDLYALHLGTMIWTRLVVPGALLADPRVSACCALVDSAILFVGGQRSSSSSSAFSRSLLTLENLDVKEFARTERTHFMLESSEFADLILELADGSLLPSHLFVMVPRLGGIFEQSLHTADGKLHVFRASDGEAPLSLLAAQLLLEWAYEDHITPEHGPDAEMALLQLLHFADRYLPHWSLAVRVRSLLGDRVASVDGVHRGLSTLFTYARDTIRFTDVTLRLRCEESAPADDGTLFPCHRLMLAAKSRFFEAMLCSGFRESSLPLIDIEAHDALSLDILLRYMYSDGGDFVLPDDPNVVKEEEEEKSERKEGPSCSERERAVSFGD